jgi:hypothetical protein
VTSDQLATPDRDVQSLVDEYVSHQSWRCTTFVWEDDDCYCGLTIDLREHGLKLPDDLQGPEEGP